MIRAKVRIDVLRTMKLVAGKTIAIKVPTGCDVLEITLTDPEGFHELDDPFDAMAKALNKIKFQSK